MTVFFLGKVCEARFNYFSQSLRRYRDKSIELWLQVFERSTQNTYALQLFCEVFKLTHFLTVKI